jgi:ferritin-like metal-binding protein YciE
VINEQALRLARIGASLARRRKPHVAQEAEDKTQEKMLDYVENAHAMEQSILRQLDAMISSTDDPEIVEVLEHHKEETQQHEQRLRERLDALGRGTSTRKEAQTIAGSLAKGIADQVRGDQAGKNARDAFATEYMEIASYELLERLANRAGDTETAEAARTNRAEDEAMAQRIAANWDKFVALTLAEEGVQT